MFGATGGVWRLSKNVCFHRVLGFCCGVSGLGFGAWTVHGFRRFALGCVTRQGVGLVGSRVQGSSGFRSEVGGALFDTS